MPLNAHFRNQVFIKHVVFIYLLRIISVYFTYIYVFTEPQSYMFLATFKTNKTYKWKGQIEENSSTLVIYILL